MQREIHIVHFTYIHERIFPSFILHFILVLIQIRCRESCFQDSINLKWSFIVAEMGEDERNIGQRFRHGTRAHGAAVRGAVYLPDLAGTGKEHMGELLPCTIRSVTEVRAVTEETLAVRAVGSATLAPHTITQVRMIIPTPRARGTVIIEPGPGQLGLCPVRGIVEVEQDSSIWLANTGVQPIHIEQDEVVAMAECFLAEPGASSGNDRDDRDEVNGLVERAAPHLTGEECRQLQVAMAARRHLFAKGKGDLGRTAIVQHQIHTGDQPAIKQRVRRYPAARREEERQLVEDMLAIGIIQESNSAWSSPTILVKKKDGTTRFCIDYRRLNQVTKVDAYPLPHIEDSLNTLGGARFFCSLVVALSSSSREDVTANIMVTGATNQATAGMPPRPPRHHQTKGDMDCQDAQQHSLQGAGWSGLCAGHGTPRAGRYERDLEGHPPEKRSAADPWARQGKPPGGRDIPRDRRVRDGGASVRHLVGIISSAALEK